VEPVDHLEAEGDHQCHDEQDHLPDAERTDCLEEFHAASCVSRKP
jgi:hypothetical protein